MSPEEMERYLDRLNEDYRDQLAGQFSLWLHTLTIADIAFIQADEWLRSGVVSTTRRLGIAENFQVFGSHESKVTAYRNAKVNRAAIEIATRAQRVNPSFQAEAAEIARALGLLHIPGPLKKPERIAEKIDNDYLVNSHTRGLEVDTLASKIKDAARCRIVIEGDPRSADQPVIEMITASRLDIAVNPDGSQQITRGFGSVKSNGIRPRYRDTKAIVAVEMPADDNQVVRCEIAIVTPEMAVACDVEHPIYEILRSFEIDGRPASVSVAETLGALPERFYRDVQEHLHQRLDATIL